MKIIDETLELAREECEKFQFDTAQTEKMIQAGKRDLQRELNRLEKVIREHPLRLEQIHHSLHALKGLFLFMGNHAASEKCGQLEQYGDALVEEEVRKLLSN